ncbi:MAG: hypothetical protein J5671_03385 [Bacteroidaceae bacterium]|nr:hypothetical protein [Bacteroidaceae bacterium]
MTPFFSNIRTWAALLIAGAIFAACSSDDNLTPDEQQPAEAKTYTLTVQATKDGESAAVKAATRALSLDESTTPHTLNATWAEGEAVTVYNETKGAALEGTLTAQSSGASTTLKGTLTGTIENGDELKLKFLSPSYSTQDGTLEYIAAHCDYAEATVEVTDASTSSVTTTAASFTNKQAIVKFTLKNKAGSASLNTATLKISDGTNTYTVNRSASANAYYVAIPGFSGKTISMLASYGTGVYDYIKSNVSFTNGQYYEITVKMDQVLAMTDATPSTGSVGKVIATDGKMYTHVRTAELAGSTASGIVAYVGSAGSVESGNSSYKGMAIALEDAILTWGSYPNHMEYCTSVSHQCSSATSYCSTVSSALNAKNGIAATTSAQANNGEGHYHNAVWSSSGVTPPSGASGWAIPSIGQWNLMAQGLTGNSSNLSDTDNPDYHYNNLSTKINVAGGTHLEWLFYWSSTEKDESYAWCFNIGGLDYGRNGSRVSAFAKNHNDEYMHVRMFFAF